MTNVTVLRDYEGEWAGLYINGKLIEEGHSISAIDTLLHLQRLGIVVCEQKEARAEDRFPDNLADAVLLT